MQLEPAALATGRALPSGPFDTTAAHHAGSLEEPARSLRKCAPDRPLVVNHQMPPTRPTQDHPEAPQHRTEPDPLRPLPNNQRNQTGPPRQAPSRSATLAAVRPPEPRTALLTHPTRHRRIRTVEPFSADDLEQRRRQQPSCCRPTTPSTDPPTPRRSPCPHRRPCAPAGGPPSRHHFEIVAG